MKEKGRIKIDGRIDGRGREKQREREKERIVTKGSKKTNHRSQNNWRLFVF